MLRAQMEELLPRRAPAVVIDTVLVPEPREPSLPPELGRAAIEPLQLGAEWAGTAAPTCENRSCTGFATTPLLVASAARSEADESAAGELAACSGCEAVVIPHILREAHVSLEEPSADAGAGAAVQLGLRNPVRVG